LRGEATDPVRQHFALWLVQNNRLSEAVELAHHEVMRDSPSESAIQLLSNVLAIAASRGAHFADAEARLSELVRGQPGNPTLLFELATLKHMQGESEAARQLYERCIQLAPYNALARNNPAMLLLDKPGADRECLLQIEEALRIAGPSPEFRDTYALVLAQHGKAEEGCRVLSSLLKEAPRNGRFLFHLAVAYQKSGKFAQAREALGKADAVRLDSEIMTPEERRLLAELRSELIGAGSAWEPQNIN
jgi:Flp pilus assembly protein TadD